jgi:hypothetical protein
MGDLADMALEGILCQTCGIYMGEGEGYPVLCENCKQEETKVDAEACPYCCSSKPPIFIHGHHQCSDCGTNIGPCCEGETGG